MHYVDPARSRSILVAHPMRWREAMGNAVRIGRLFGIELRVDPSWLFIFVLVGWSLTSLFASWHPDWSPAMSIVVAIAAALAFFASVLIHELAHALVALAYDIPVRDITLFLFGGVSSIEREPPTPTSEVVMAIIGPIASIGLGISMLFVSALLIDLRTTDVDAATTAISHLGPVETLFVWLGPVNIMLGLFNMIPGFPLDGGRVLRGIVWKVTGSLEKATRIATGAGQVIGWVFVFLGLAMVLGYRIPLLGRGLVSGIWLVMIGLFLRNAAAQHLRGAQVDEALAGVAVKDLMRTNGAFVAPNVSLREIVNDWFLRHDQLAYPVIDASGIFVGIVSVEDLRKAKPDEFDKKTVRDVMTPLPRIIATSSLEPLADAARKLVSSGVGQLPVLDQGVLVGMLYAKDVDRWVELRRQYMRESERPRVRHA